MEKANRAWQEHKSKDEDEQQAIIRSYFAHERRNTRLVTFEQSETAEPGPSQPAINRSTSIPLLTAPKNAAKQSQIVEKINAVTTHNAGLAIALSALPTTSAARSTLMQEKTENDIQLRVLGQEFLKRKKNAEAQQRCREKKAKLLTDEKKVVSYDTVGRPPKYIEYPDLLFQMHDIVDLENEATASNRRRTNDLGVTTLKHLKEELRYTMPRKSNSIAARRHHTPAAIRIDRIENSEMKIHVDGYYCNTSQKYVRDLCAFLKDRSVFISQDDKAKVEYTNIRFP